MKKLLILCLLFYSILSHAQSGNIEYKIKAGYLYNFTKFISWPEDPSSTFNICILGKDPFKSILDPIENRTVKNKPIRLFRLSSKDESRHCHILYLSLIDRKILFQKQILPGTLVISSLEQIIPISEKNFFTEAGGMIAFYLKEDRVKLLINEEKLKKSGLEISAKLLEIAEIYRESSDE